MTMTYSPTHRRYTLLTITIDRFRSLAYRNSVLLITVVLAALLLVAVVFLGNTATAAKPAKGVNAQIQKGQPTPFWMRTPCEYEDSVNCYWDAGRRGNGAGQSFYIRDLPGPATCLFYVNRKYAKKHDSCFPDDV